ncbi:hypothetical protein DH2020_045340 [Rehmannia glutinosa]|uniref:RNase H type-1 domain-containing protein n=1 Tax=Rehmannia glutinosa TaxID=99300 RepID=A0ABR0UF43_REHGL
MRPKPMQTQQHRGKGGNNLSDKVRGNDHRDSAKSAEGSSGIMSPVMAGTWREKSSLSYLHNIDSQCLNNANQIQQPTEQEWQAPGINSIKINFDATVSLKKNCGGVGFIARDHNGLSLGWKRIRIHGRLHPTTAEAIAAREAILFAKEKGWRNIVVEGDCLAVITGIPDEDDKYSVESPIYQDIRALLEEFQSYELKHVQRSVNLLAHRIATFCDLDCHGSSLPF